jgi:predicted HAD superfamily Cof-like phosphohydrolase
MTNKYKCSCGKEYASFSSFNAHLTLNRDHYEKDETEPEIAAVITNPIPTIKLVRDWHIQFGVPVLDKPTIPDADRMQLRVDLLYEELEELEDAIAIKDIVEIFDALLDLQYIIDGSLCEFGLHKFKEAGFAEVHRSNMSKAGEDGNPIKREDGKILKGPLFTAPDLQAILGGDYDTEE